MLLAVEAPFDPSVYTGEEVQYSISMMGGEAARAEMSVGAPVQDKELGRVVPFQGVVSSVGLLSAIVKFKYAGLTYVDTQSGYPVWSKKLLEDKGRSRTYETYYDRTNYRADITRRENGNASPRHRMIPRYADDIMTWLFRLRQADLDVGDTYTVYIFDGWRIRRLTLRVLEHAKRPATLSNKKRVHAAKILVRADSVQAQFPLPWATDAATLPPVYHVKESNRVATMWFSLDDRRVPLSISLQTPVGFVTMELTDYRPPTVAR